MQWASLWWLLAALMVPSAVFSFTTRSLASRAVPSSSRTPPRRTARAHRALFAAPREQVSLDFSEMSDVKVEALFAWVSRAFAGDERYAIEHPS